MKQTRGIISLRTKIAVGYALIIVLIGGIVGTYLQEWRQLEALDTETRHIRMLWQSVHEVYVRIVEIMERQNETKGYRCHPRARLPADRQSDRVRPCAARPFVPHYMQVCVAHPSLQGVDGGTRFLPDRSIRQ